MDGPMVGSESRNITSGMPSRNRTLSWTGYSGTFKGIPIGVCRNPERGVVIVHKNVDIISETYEDTGTGKLRNRGFQPLIWSPVWGQFSDKKGNLYCQKVGSLINLSAADILAYFHWNFCGGLRKTHLFYSRVRVWCYPKSPRSMILVPIESAYDFLLVHHRNYGHILHRFWKFQILPRLSHLAVGTPSP